MIQNGRKWSKTTKNGQLLPNMVPKWPEMDKWVGHQTCLGFGKICKWDQGERRSKSHVASEFWVDTASIGAQGQRSVASMRVETQPNGILIIFFRAGFASDAAAGNSLLLLTGTSTERRQV